MKKFKTIEILKTERSILPDNLWEELVQPIDGEAFGNLISTYELTELKKLNNKNKKKSLSRLVPPFECYKLNKNLLHLTKEEFCDLVFKNFSHMLYIFLLRIKIEEESAAEELILDKYPYTFNEKKIDKNYRIFINKLKFCNQRTRALKNEYLQQILNIKFIINVWNSTFSRNVKNIKFSVFYKKYFLCDIQTENILRSALGRKSDNNTYPTDSPALNDIILDQEFENLMSVLNKRKYNDYFPTMIELRSSNKIPSKNR